MWNLYQNNIFLEPLVFSNGKSQKDIVSEVLDLINQGQKIIFIRGVCGTGKSAIALNIARKIGKTSVVVPGKVLQRQYKRDYEKEKYLLKENGERLNISVITGRNNHKCKFLEDNQNIIPKIKKEINSKLHDIFEGKRQEIKERAGEDLSADNRNLPCKIEIKEKNWSQIKQYLKQNKHTKIENFLDIKDVKRIPVASVCPYWSPVLEEKYDIAGGAFKESKKRKYAGLNNTKFIFYQRKPGCGFYEQFNSYIDSDVIVFNSLKYKLESAMNRKPLTEIEIIDECDEFLDSFANQSSINLERFQNSLMHITGSTESTEKIISEMQSIIKQIKKDERINNAIFSKEIIPLKETGVYDLIKLLLNFPEILDETDEESYVAEVAEISRMFEDFIEETYLTVDKKEGNLVLSLVTINLAKRFQEMINKNKIIILMSGTIHSELVLKDLFGLNNFKIIEAEVENQGRIKVKRTNLEMDCKYSNFSNGKYSRKEYLQALDKCIEIAKKPALVHIGAFTDMPTEQEIEEFELKNLMTREKIKRLQKKDKDGKAIEDFKKGEIKVLFSTKVSRGIDFPGEQCNSIIFTKYPNPNVKDAFWNILYKTKPQHYWEFYKDKARRELWQKIYRGLRFKDDSVDVLSPDIRVLEAFEKYEK